MLKAIPQIMSKSNICSSVVDAHNVAYVRHFRKLIMVRIDHKFVIGAKLWVWYGYTNTRACLLRPILIVVILRHLRRHHAMPVYFIADADNKYVKIGHSYDPQKRLADLQTSNPLTLRIVRQQPGGVREEKMLHKAWAHRRVNGEWFHYDEQMFGLYNPLKDDCFVGTYRERTVARAEIKAQGYHDDRARIYRFIKAAGGSSKLAVRLKVTNYAIHYWLKNGLTPKGRRKLDEYEASLLGINEQNKCPGTQ